MKEYCEKHIVKEFKNRRNQIHIMGRVLPSQTLSPEQQKCKSGSNCHDSVKWIVRYISEMNVRVVPKNDNKVTEDELHDSV